MAHRKTLGYQDSLALSTRASPLAPPGLAPSSGGRPAAQLRSSDLGGGPGPISEGPERTSCHIYVCIFRGLRPEAGNAGSRGDLSHVR